jgi:hypothetical protein
MTVYMLDTNVFNKLTDGKISFCAFRDLDIRVTHIQWDELNATKDSARKADLLRTFKKVDPRMSSTAAAVWDASKWDQSSWTPEDGVVEKMLEQLEQLDKAAGKKHRDPKNRLRDVLIGHTAIDINATLISDDPQLRLVVGESGGRAISTLQILANPDAGNTFAFLVCKLFQIAIPRPSRAMFDRIQRACRLK